VEPGREVTLTTQLAVEQATHTRGRLATIKAPTPTTIDRTRVPDSKQRVSTKTSKKRMTFTSSSLRSLRKETQGNRIRIIEGPTLIKIPTAIFMALIKGLSDVRARTPLVRLARISTKKT